MSFIGELKRRNVIRVAILYFVSSWLLLQLTDVLSSILPVPDWTGSFVFAMLLICLAPALIFSWVYEMTPEGLRREVDVDRSRSITPNTGKKINTVIVVLLVLAIAGMAVDRIIPEDSAPARETVSTSSATKSADPASIAVLPFADLSEEGDQQFFTDGLSEELLNLLVRIEGLSVASRTSAFAFRGSTLGMREIAQELGVAHVLEGSVRKFGDRIRVTAQLIEASTDRHLWSDNFDRELNDIFAIQDEIGTAIVAALKDELGLEATVDVTAVTSNMDAYAMYLEARELFIRRENLLESIRLFRGAIALDPEFAKAWEGLAAVEMVTDDWVYHDGVDHWPLAREAAEEALSLDSDLSMPFAVIGLYNHSITFDRVAAESNYAKAVERDPKNTTAWLWYGLFAKESGFLDEAESYIRNCFDIDPGYQNCRQHLALILLIQGRDDEAFEVFESTLPGNFHSTSSFFVPAYLERGQTALATLLAASDTRDSAAPIAEWIAALQSPGADHSNGYARWKDWEQSNDSGLLLVDLDNLLLAFGRYEEFASDQESALGGVWLPYAAPFRTTPYFKDLIRQGGVYAYWQEKGFPDFCRPVGNDDFECDDPR